MNLQQHDEEIEDLKAEHKNEIKQLAAELDQKLKDKEEEFKTTFAQAYGKMKIAVHFIQLQHVIIIVQ